SNAVQPGASPMSSAWASPNRTRPDRSDPLLIGRKQQLRIEAYVEPVHAPVHVWPGRPASRTDGTDHLSLLDAIADIAVEAAEVDEGRRDAVSVIDRQRATGEVEVGVREDHHATGRCFQRRARRHRDV